MDMRPYLCAICPTFVYFKMSPSYIFTHLKVGWSNNKVAMFLSCSTHLDVTIRTWKLKFWSIIPYPSFDLKFKCFQCIAKTKKRELAFQFQYLCREMCFTAKQCRDINTNNKIFRSVLEWQPENRGQDRRHLFHSLAPVKSQAN